MPYDFVNDNNTLQQSSNGTGEVPSTQTPVPEIMNAQEVADYLRVNYITAVRNLKQGKYPGTKVGGQWRTRRDDLDRFLGRTKEPKFPQDILHRLQALDAHMMAIYQNYEGTHNPATAD